MDREELKALIRTEPTKRATLAAVEPECLAAESHAAALRGKCDSLLADLAEIEIAKQELAVIPATKQETGESASDDPAAKPLKAKRTNP